jgi:hypothetical protein
MPDQPGSPMCAASRTSLRRTGPDPTGGTSTTWPLLRPWRRLFFRHASDLRVRRRRAARVTRAHRELARGCRADRGHEACEARRGAGSNPSGRRWPPSSRSRTSTRSGVDRVSGYVGKRPFADRGAGRADLRTPVVGRGRCRVSPNRVRRGRRGDRASAPTRAADSLPTA